MIRMGTNDDETQKECNEKAGRSKKGRSANQTEPQEDWTEQWTTSSGYEGVISRSQSGVYEEGWLSSGILRRVVW